MSEEKQNNKEPNGKRPDKDPFQELFKKMNKGKKGNNDKNRLIIFAAITLAFFLILQFFIFPEIDVKRLSYGEFYDMVERNLNTGEIKSAELIENVVRGRLADGTYFQVNVPPTDLELVPILRRNIEEFNVNPPKVFWKNMIYSMLPVLLLIGFFWFFVYRGAKQGGAGGILSFGKSRAKQNDPTKDKVTFKDVAGVEEPKEELQEIIEF